MSGREAKPSEALLAPCTASTPLSSAKPVCFCALDAQKKRILREKIYSVFTRFKQGRGSSVAAQLSVLESIMDVLEEYSATFNRTFPAVGRRRMLPRSENLPVFRFHAASN